MRIGTLGNAPARALGAPLPPALPPRVRDVHHLALRLTGRSPSATREARENPISRHAALPLCSAASSPGALDSAASVSAISRRMMPPTERTSLMPPRSEEHTSELQSRGQL